MKEHPNLFRTLKTKAIARVRVTTADIEEVKDWFNGFRTWCKEHDIQPRDVLNFDEAGFRIPGQIHLQNSGHGGKREGLRLA